MPNIIKDNVEYINVGTLVILYMLMIYAMQ